MKISIFDNPTFAKLDGDTLLLEDGSRLTVNAWLWKHTTILEASASDLENLQKLNFQFWGKSKKRKSEKKEFALAK